MNKEAINMLNNILSIPSLRTSLREALGMLWIKWWIWEENFILVEEGRRNGQVQVQLGYTGLSPEVFQISKNIWLPRGAREDLNSRDHTHTDR